jgi:hypothetical protein
LAACASPTAARPHAIPIAAINTIDAPLPISSNWLRASGFNRQIDSRELPGKARASIVTRQISPAAAKKITSKIVPTDRHDWFIRKTTDRLPLLAQTFELDPFNVFLTLSRNSLTNATAKVRPDLGKFYERIDCRRNHRHSRCERTLLTLLRAAQREAMSDLIFAGIIVAFFVGGALYVRFCEKL